MDAATDIKRGFYASWAEVPMDGWRWPNFTPKELSCKCGGRFCRGEYFHDPEFMDQLQALRTEIGAPFVINSARRCRRHNDSPAVGGASRSQHVVAIAVDINLHGHNPVHLARAAVRHGFSGIGFGASFLHLDNRQTRAAFHYPNGKATWLARFGFDPVSRLQQRGAL